MDNKPLRYIDTGKVRFVLREFPIGKSSGLRASLTSPTGYLGDHTAAWLIFDDLSANTTKGIVLNYNFKRLTV
jgi:hypothetical protein